MNLLVNIDVDDLERAIAFYANALGLRLERRLFKGMVAEMGGASSRIYLLTHPAGSRASLGASASRTYDRHWTPVHLDFETGNVDAAVARAVDAGAKLEGSIQNFAWGRLATLSDPFGHGFCLLQFTDRGYDAVA
ncbi:MAG TPA: VOC family protein [Casimicrobiaceae bacterium]|nr:VOC family protein [Casimicrobiaceae bacterium]